MSIGARFVTACFAAAFFLLILVSLAACGGGGDEDQQPDVPTPGPDCKAKPELCK